MKKIGIILLILTVSVSASAQIFQKKTPDQNPADVHRALIVDIPRTDSLDAKDGIRPVLAYTHGSSPILILAKQNEYDTIKHLFSEEMLPKMGGDVLVAYDFAVMYVPKFSYLTKKQIKKLSGSQKSNAQALNELDKYTLLAQSVKPVYARWVYDDKLKTDKLVILQSVTTQQPNQYQQPQVLAPQVTQPKTLNKALGEIYKKNN